MPRFLTIIRADERNAPTQEPTPELAQRMGELYEEITKAGVMLDTAALAPSSEATRLTWTDGELSRIDGPFTETKEVIGGYSLIQAKDKAEALYWAQRFGEIQGLHENLVVEVREIVEG
ncbi:YciI family protein [Streptomyces sp. NPDC003077]|uniref:YciI family protein n=1 Tax=Streptomyces sp. NPDC003077 TaxID=3154443 RepID=UPI0033AEF6A6